MNRSKTALILSMLLLPSAAFAANPPPAANKATPPNPADTVFTAWDADHNGSLTQAEFRQGWARLQTRMQVEQRLRAQFQHLDTDRNGTIDAKEYAGVELAKKAGTAAPMSRFDLNYDQKLNFAEYVGLVQTLAPNMPAPAAAPATGR
ncbi:EF-hand domain-containing protein [Cognatilysobacter terrigena]|uniref:EF-hand domain-containing protein n=1 Tax=Cognatilysobacter terrigena TaxID=2488749 RepID=UPI00105BAC15|nr:EF-hand domain-containing protein [Lysobacter terrigena]